MLGLGRKGKQAKGDQTEEGKSKLPLFNGLAGVRHVDDEAAVVVDWAWKKYAVWEVDGVDSSADTAANGWSNFLNAIDRPVQILVRQHRPDMGAVRGYYTERRPERMKSGRVGQVADSLVDMLERCQESTTVVQRRYYVVAEQQQQAGINSLLLQTGFRVRQLDGPKLWDLYSGCASGMGAGHVQDMYQARVLPDRMELNHRFVRIFEMFRWPRSIDLMFLEKLFQTGEELDVSLYVWPVSGRESHSRLVMQKSRSEGARLHAVERGRMVPPDVEATLEDVGRLLREVEKGVARLYRVNMTMAVYGRHQEDLKRASDKLVGHFRSKMSGVRVLKYRQDGGFKCLMPTLRRGVGEQYLTDTGTMLRLFPFSPPDMFKGEGTLFGLDMRSRSPVLYDAFEYGMNAHHVVMARSGAGKSFYVKLRTLREVARGIPYYVIDPDGEYGTLANTLGGRVLVPGRPGHGLNPFVVRFTGWGDLMLRVGGLVSLIEVMLQGEVNQERKAMIDKCLVGFYGRELSKFGRDAMQLMKTQPEVGLGGMESFYDYLKSDDHELAESGEEMSSLVERFATGTVQYLMGGTGANLFDDELPVTTFNLRHLSTSLKPVATSVCSEVVWGLAISQPRQRMLIVDECWTVLATPSGAEALLTIAKRARKYKLGLLTITQDVQDFLGEDSSGGAIMGHAGLSLLQNSGSKMVLSQDPAALPLVANALQLDGDCAMYLKGCVTGQGLLVTDYGKFPVEVVSTKMEQDMLNDESWRQDGEGYDPAYEIAEIQRIMDRQR